MDMFMNAREDPSTLSPDRGAPRITSTPSADSPLAHSEDEIVGILTDIYQHFTNISCLEPE